MHGKVSSLYTRDSSHFETIPVAQKRHIPQLLDPMGDANTVTWTVTRQGRDGNPIATVYKATVDGDNMKGTATSGDRPARDFTGTRKK